MAYTFGQLEGLWIRNGGPPAVAPVMAAIGLAESTGNNVKQQNQPYRTTGWGIWQITPGNSVPSIGTDAALLDPDKNAQAAVYKYKRQGLGAWTTYTNGAFRQYMKAGVPPDTTAIPKGSTSGTVTNGQQVSLPGDIGGAIGKGFADALSAVFQPFINILIWGTETLIGLGLLIAGVLLMAGQTSAGKEAEVDAALLAVPEASAGASAAKAVEM